MSHIVILVDNDAKSDMDQERKIQELDDKSNDILDQLNKLGDYVYHINFRMFNANSPYWYFGWIKILSFAISGEYLKHTSNQISNLDSTMEFHQGEFDAWNKFAFYLIEKIIILVHT